MNSKTIKVASAAIGASAVVAMGALTAALSDDSGSATVVSSTEMTLGETSTIEKAASPPETSVASPTVTAETPDGFGPVVASASSIARAVAPRRCWLRVTVAPVRVASTVTVSFGATDCERQRRPTETRRSG